MENNLKKLKQLLYHMDYKYKTILRLRNTQKIKAGGSLYLFLIFKIK